MNFPTSEAVNLITTRHAHRSSSRSTRSTQAAAEVFHLRSKMARRNEPKRMWDCLKSVQTRQLTTSDLYRYYMIL